MSNPAFTEQRHYRFQSDSADVNDSGTELGADDTPNTVDIALDGVFFLRIKIVNTGDMAANDAYTLQYEKNNTGGFITVTTTSSNVRVATGQETDATACTELLPNDGGTYANGEYDDVDGSVDANIGAGNEVEHVFSITCRSAEMSVGDTLDFRCQTGGANLDEYDVTAECTVVAAVAGADPFFETEWPNPAVIAKPLVPLEVGSPLALTQIEPPAAPDVPASDVYM